MSVEDAVVRCDSCGAREIVRPVVQEHLNRFMEFAEVTRVILQPPREWVRRYGPKGNDCVHLCGVCAKKGVVVG